MIRGRCALAVAQVGAALMLLACTRETPTLEAPPPTPRPSGVASTGSGEPVDDEQADLNRRLVEAARDGDVKEARRLVRAGADVNWRDEQRESAHLLAASEGHLELLRLTLRHGADVSVHDSYDGTGLIRAAERGHDLVVGRLLQTDIPVDHVNNLGWTALHEAIALGDGTGAYRATVRALIAGGADVVSPAEHSGQTPLEMARGAEQIAVADTVQAALGDAPIDADEALLEAAREGAADSAAVAIRAGADLEARDADRRTPLLLAVTGDHLDTARLLVALGANSDAVDGQSDTPWLVTGVTGSVSMARLLLRYGPDLALLNRFGGTSVIPAAERGHADYVRLIAIRTDMDLDHVNDLGWTAMLEAVVLGDGGQAHQEIVRTLLDAGADQQIGDKDGVTPLEHAERAGQGAVVRILRAHHG